LETLGIELIESVCNCRCGRRERLATPCDDWRHRGPATGHPRHGPPTYPHFSDDDPLEPVYATISEITVSLDETSVLPAGQLLFHDLVPVFADLAALPVVDVGDGSSRASSAPSSPPPVLTDTPPDRQGTVPQPVPGRVVDCPSYDQHHRHTTITSPLRFYTYC